jgi:hypothetical protein
MFTATGGKWKESDFVYSLLPLPTLAKLKTYPLKYPCKFMKLNISTCSGTGPNVM